MRGGSFAVGPVACRGTFRNWDYPIRRQIFAGFRTARDGAPEDGARPGSVPGAGAPADRPGGE
jgi:gamma-glutamyl hercynylcysteine S-oxide synthase